MQGIFGASLISRCVLQGVLFALHVVAARYTTRECYNISRIFLRRLLSKVRALFASFQHTAAILYNGSKLALYRSRKRTVLSMCSVMSVMYCTVHAVAELLKFSVTATHAMV